MISDFLLQSIDWNDFLSEEEKVMRKFIGDPKSRNFLTIFDILKQKEKYHTLAEELLKRGIENYPTYFTARVVWSKYLFDKGLIYKAWQCLDPYQSELGSHVGAIKLLLKLNLLLGKFDDAESCLGKLKAFPSHMDREFKLLLDRISLEGNEAGKEYLENILASNGVSLEVVPEAKNIETSDDSEVDNISPGDDLLDSMRFENFDNYKCLKLNDIFSKNVGEHPEQSGGGESNEMEMDSTTLADIFESQGHFRRALAIYKRLTKLNPGNEYLRIKIKELNAKLDMQKQEDIEVDPEWVDKMEGLEIIDKKIDFYTQLSEKIKSSL